MKKIRSTLLLFMVLAINSLTSYAQTCGPMSPSADSNCQQCITVSLPSSVRICPGASYSFTPAVSTPIGFTIKQYFWSGTVITPSSGTGLPPLTTITPPSPVSAPACSVLSYPYSIAIDAYAPNVVLNPAFTAGNTDFCSDYYYNPTPSTLSSPEYTVCNDGSITPGWFPIPGTPYNFYDHTTGTPAGSMLVGNGNANVNVVWEQEVPVCPGGNYDLTFWQATLRNSSGYFGTYAELYAAVMDASGVVTTLGSFTNHFYDKWEKYTANWTNPAAGGYTTAKLFIYGGGPIGSPWSTIPYGTVFAIDDISFNRVCKASANMTIDVEYPEITGPKRVCISNSISLTGCPAGGTWSSTPEATVDAMGNVTGISSGTATITYTSPTGCTTTKSITVNSLPVINGPTVVCTGSGITWTSGSAGYWIPSSHFYYSPSGLAVTTAYLTGAVAGTGTITFIDSATGCSTTDTITVNQTPAPLPPYYVCLSYIGLVLPGSPAGGTWHSSNPAIATIDSVTGAVNPVGVGTTIITYTLAGCSRTTTLTVYPCANGAGVVGGNLCQGQTRTFLTALGIPTGGTWSSSNTGVATVDSVTGLVTAMGGGTTIISYTVGGTTWTLPVTVYPAATATVTTSCCPYSFNFTSTCAGGGTIYYVVRDQFGATLGYGTTTPGSSILYSTLVATYGPEAYTVCIYRLDCICTWWVNSCASVNSPKPGGLAVNDMENEQQLSIVPNPTKGSFSIKGAVSNNNSTNSAYIEIVDMMGKLVLKDVTTIENGTINKQFTLGDNVADGIYIVTIKTGNNIQKIKLVLDR